LFGVMIIAYRLAGYKGLPMVALISFILIGVYMFLTLRTVIGRRIYAVGGNAKAAMLSGVNSKRIVLFTFVNMGVLAAFGGMIIAAWFNSATPRPATASSSTSSRPRSSAARRPTAASVRSRGRSSAPVQAVY
jgi:putative multiple sugar transport system permease protein